MSRSFITKLASLLLSVSILSGCGFHFRGDYHIPKAISNMSLTSYDQYATLTRMVQTELRMNGITVVPPASDTVNLHLLSESVSERTLSLYQNTRAAEKELTYRANYRVLLPNKELKVFTTQVNRSFLANSMTALAKSVERDLIEDEMREQAAKQIMRQLARLRKSYAEEISLEEQDTFTLEESALSQEESASQEVYILDDSQAPTLTIPQEHDLNTVPNAGVTQ